MGTKTQNQMLDLLDQAYHVSDDVDKLDALLDSANAYLFDDQKNAVVSRNLQHFAELDPHLEAHIDRLQGLMAQQTNDERPGLTIGHHAQLIISDKGRILTANKQTRELFDEQPKGFITDLPINHDSIRALQDIIKEIAAGVQNLERIIYLQVETDITRSVFGYCRVIPMGDDQRGLHISLSYFDWSPAIFENLQSALNLSNSEGLVLQGILKGQSHKEIAEQRKRSLNTIKTQAKAVLHKAGCAKMTELAHLCASIAYVIGMSDMVNPTAGAGTDWVTPRQGLHMVPLPGNRTLAYYEYGDPKGKPIVYIHGFFQGPYFLDTLNRGFLKNGFRIIAPSRPFFGYTSPPGHDEDFNTVVNDDVLCLIKHLKLKDDILIVSHHGGASHAFRLAKRIEAQLSGMVLIGAGIPITSEHIHFMSKQARMTSVASRHAPSVLKLIATMGLRTYRKKGIHAFLDDHYAPNPTDALCLDDPVIKQKLCEGLFHLTQQGADAFVHDGRAQLADWTEDFEAVKCRQTWVHGRHCHLMGAHFVQDYVTARTNHPVEIIEDAGYNILYQNPGRILTKICEAATWA